MPGNRGLVPGIRLYDVVGISHGSDLVQPKESEAIIQAGEDGKTEEKQRVSQRAAEEERPPEVFISWLFMLHNWAK
jgi:hypothetical protein